MEVFSCENGLYLKPLRFSNLLSWFPPFGLLERFTWEMSLRDLQWVYITLISWIEQNLSAWTNLWDLSFFKNVFVRMFFMKKYFPAEYVFIIQLFLYITFFSCEHSVFWVSFSLLIIFLRWVLYYAYKICSKSRLPKTLGFICFNLNNLKMMNAFYFICKALFVLKG